MSGRLGSARRKRLRKLWLLKEFGDGITAPCVFCGCNLTIETLTVDHHPIPACRGGTWAKNNIRPACAPCNEADGVRMERELRERWRSGPLTRRLEEELTQWQDQ